MLVLSQISAQEACILLFPGLGRVSEHLFHSLLHRVTQWPHSWWRTFRKRRGTYTRTALWGFTS